MIIIKINIKRNSLTPISMRYDITWLKKKFKYLLIKKKKKKNSNTKS